MSKTQHWLHLLFMNALTVIISVVAVFYALGYQVNWQTHAIQQTGIISLNATPKQEVLIKVNGKVVSTSLPFRYTRILPGQYSVSIEKAGSQTWSRDVAIEPNKVASFPSIILVKQQPLVRVPTSSEQSALDSYQPNKDGLVVQENEIRNNDKLLTRISEDIQVIEWFPDRQHVVYQAGQTVWLLDLDGLGSQKIATLESKVPIALVFTEGGRVMVYKTTPKTASVVELY